VGSAWLEFATLVIKVEGLRHKLDKFNAVWRWITICAWCRKIRDSEGSWQQPQPNLEQHAGITFSHGICPMCADQAYTAYRDEKTSESGPPPFGIPSDPQAAGATRNVGSTATASQQTSQPLVLAVDHRHSPASPHR